MRIFLAHQKVRLKGGSSVEESFKRFQNTPSMNYEAHFVKYYSYSLSLQEFIIYTTARGSDIRSPSDVATTRARASEVYYIYCGSDREEIHVAECGPRAMVAPMYGASEHLSQPYSKHSCKLCAKLQVVYLSTPCYRCILAGVF